jgi:hypothetical protein
MMKAFVNTKNMFLWDLGHITFVRFLFLHEIFMAWMISLISRLSSLQKKPIVFIEPNKIKNDGDLIRKILLVEWHILLSCVLSRIKIV